jgi:rhodanese-related sulfurtransferase
MIICSLALIPGLGSALFHPKRPAWTREMADDEIDLAAAMQWKERALWIDARSSEHYEQGHVPGALLLNMQEWDQQLDAVLDRWEPGRPVIVYCGSAACDASREVAAHLRNDVQFDHVYVLKGGWEAWKAAQK